MSKRTFNYWDHQWQKQQRPWMRTGDSLVAVNPERVITLLELAQEHYGRKCVRCGSTKRLTVHHRHYRTIGFEKPVEDIVLLCWDCSADLHTRSKNKRLNRDDIPFVDPKWASWLEQKAPPEGEESRSDDYPEPHYFYVVFRDDAGKEGDFLILLWNPDDLEGEVVRRMKIDDMTEVVSIEHMGVWREDLLARVRSKSRKA